MTLFRHDIQIPRLTAEELAQWADIPSAIASDCLNRSQAMAGAICPLQSDMRVVAQARTVQCMVGDNSALHGAIGICAPGDVLVCDGQGFEDTALFGGLLTRSAMMQGVGGLVIDGAIRDSTEIITAGFPCFARAAVPAGPHKGFGGVIDGPISCGGVTVHPGDLVVGDADGVCVVPFAQVAETLNLARSAMEREQSALASLESGGSLAGIYSVPEIQLIDRQ
jgi:4-hydroxy-4-methyl-2-oxoglutarate aldolase